MPSSRSPTPRAGRQRRTAARNRSKNDNPYFEPWIRKAQATTAYADLLDNGVVRGRERSPAPILADLNTLENSIRRDLAALALTVEAAAEVGVKLSRARTRRRRIDLSRLTDQELAELGRLVGNAEEPDEA